MSQEDSLINLEISADKIEEAVKDGNATLDDILFKIDEQINKPLPKQVEKKIEVAIDTKGIISSLKKIEDKIEKPKDISGLLKEISGKIKPVVIPDMPDVIIPENIDYTKDLKDIKDKIEPVDLKKVEKLLKEIDDKLDKIKKFGGSTIISGGGVSNSQPIQDRQTETTGAINDQLDNYKITDKDDDATPLYYGYTDKNGGWYIMKWVVSAGADTFRYIKGDSDYTTAWTGRAGLTYDYFYTIF
jgi:hypothetical protein